MSTSHTGEMKARPTRFRLAAIAAVFVTLVTGSIIGAAPAYATDYPTWSDVAAVRNDQAATSNQIAVIQSLLAGLDAEAKRTQADAEAKGVVWQAADLKFQIAADRAQTLQAQADAASAKATSSEQKAGQWAAQLARSGGGDMTANLLTNSGNADNLLNGLSMSSKISSQAYAIYERALLDRNTAQALTDQADVAANELKDLKLVAEKAFNEAQAASIAAATALKEQQDHEAVLAQQLIVLTEKRAATEADYLAGVRERIGSGASLDAGEISLSGFVRPAAGPITDDFGYRVSPTSGASTYHQGTDIGAYCGAPIYAATSGTVSYAGWNGGYGNFILIDHGGGLQSAYGHIVNGGILVSIGQSVEVGQQIASVGTTGTSTGCHLHFEIRVDGVARDAVPFMASEGITIG